MKKLRTKAQEIRTQAEQDIKALLEKYHLDSLYLGDLYCGSGTPVLEECKYDGNLTYTLDRIDYTNGYLEFEGSNVSENGFWNTYTITLDALIDIAEYLSNNEEEIKEYAEMDDDE